MPLTIPNGAKFTIKPVGKTDGFDGHSLRAYKYFSDKMPDIKAKMAKVNEPGEFFKVTDNDGNVEYYHESDLPNHLRLLLK